jgi:DNA-binding response OmpR family regulator
MPEAGRIFVVEDDPDIARLVRFALEAQRFDVRLNSSGERFLEEVRQFGPHLIVLDLMLPSADGLQLLRQLRRDMVYGRLPVIVLTARTSESDRVKGLDLGADDYVSKPFSTMELLARIRARLRASPAADLGMLEVGALQLNLRARTARFKGEPLALSDTEFRILAFLAKAPGTAFTRRQIIDGVWSPSHFISERSIDVYMLRLRNKIEADSADPRHLTSARGHGYRYEP